MYVHNTYYYYFISYGYNIGTYIKSNCRLSHILRISCQLINYLKIIGMESLSALTNTPLERLVYHNIITGLFNNLFPWRLSETFLRIERGNLSNLFAGLINVLAFTN